MKPLVELTRLNRRTAPRCLVLRPCLLSKAYTIERHKDTLAYMAARLTPHIDRCIFRFVEMYFVQTHSFSVTKKVKKL